MRKVAVLVSLLAAFAAAVLTGARSPSFPTKWARRNNQLRTQLFPGEIGDVALIHSKNLIFVTVEKIDQNDYCLRPWEHAPEHRGIQFINLSPWLGSSVLDWLGQFLPVRHIFQDIPICDGSEKREGCLTTKIEEFGGKEFTLCPLYLGGESESEGLVCYDGVNACPY